jgi:hypothetical protein
LETQIYIGSSQISAIAKPLLLGPRPILSVREHHAKYVADNDAAIEVTSIALQERVYVSTSSVWHRKWFDVINTPQKVGESVLIVSL